MTARLLFVCSGNLHRSVMGAALMDAMLAQAGCPARVTSAGTLGLRGHAAPPQVQTVCNELGLDVSGHRAQPLSQTLIQSAHAIIVMAEEHGEAVLEFDPGAQRRLYYLGDFADPPGDIFDPIGQPVEVFRQSRDHILGALQQLLPELLPRLPR